MLDALLTFLPDHPVVSGVLVVLGLLLLWLAADLLVDGASTLSLHLGIPPLIVGLTVVAFGTSAPELFTAIGAALNGAGELAIGNAIGSNIANLALIVGVAALVRPIVVDREAAYRDAPIMAMISVLAVFPMLDGELSRTDGIILLAGLLVYLLAYALRGAGSSLAEPPKDDGKRSIFVPLVLTVLGFISLAVAAEGLVIGSVRLAQWAGVPDLIIGITIVAFGTSLPELATSIRAALKGQGSLAVGNVLGSNVFNLLAVLGAGSLTAALPVARIAIGRDVFVMLAVTLLAVGMLASRLRVDRWEGALLVAGYLVYIVAAIGLS